MVLRVFVDLTDCNLLMVFDFNKLEARLRWVHNNMVSALFLGNTTMSSVEYDFKQ